ncbi:o-succinylbenzoate--CoA ligase [Vibrio algarum]|uniref:O-succinylbenzoate--CoA ligase n=1 Tax=Vibrio algarum TaxID=3020714 RepID=A0ABT4YSC7_9VIBR|nr:o-succinylbenzoate--CoA ligase [Vibrio sp. KJ40-1]MDB1124464.1 o-succinylbenzoate--CoA ligase [Vibrio sp. KJ40-1]
MSQSDNSVQYWLLKWSEISPDKCALVSDNSRYSWAQLTSLVNNASATLRDQNIVQGDAVALVSKNSFELLLTYLACVNLGAVPALITPSTENVIVPKLDTLDCKSVWFGSDALGHANRMCLGKDYSLLKLTAKDIAKPYPTITHGVHSENLVSIVFTSGSTGPPKAVAHTHKQHEASAQGLLARFHFGPNDTWLLSLPMFHVSGLAIVWRWLTVGAQLKIGSGKNLFTDLLGVTHASLVPTQLKRILSYGEKLTLTRVLLGGSHIPLPLVLEANQRGIDTWLGYGMTEAASTVLAKQVNGKEGVGFLLPNRKLKVEEQRIYIGGDTLASGYYYQGKLKPIVENGWFDSKDLGVLQDDELRILGRADNLFISGGENIHCEEIEAVLTQHENILNAVIIPVQDDEYGARPIAIIQSEHALDKEEFEQFLLQRLDKFKWPDEYFEMPKVVSQDPSIKLSRIKVKEWFISSRVSKKKVI